VGRDVAEDRPFKGRSYANVEAGDSHLPGPPVCEPSEPTRGQDHNLIGARLRLGARAMSSTNVKNEAFAEWSKDRDGAITVCPMAGYATAVFAGMGGVLRLEFVRSPDQLGKHHESLQLGMTLDQAKELGEALLRMSAKADLSVPTGVQRN
jgi:hypothetical protein